MSNLVDKAMELQVMTCLDSLLNRANHDEYLQRIGKKEALSFLEENSKYADIIKSNLHRLEDIDNANPSEALECLEEMWELSCDSRKPEYSLYEYIKQALIKAQEPKKYLKWEDLEFTNEVKEMKVKLGDNTYEIEYYICNALGLHNPVVILKTSDFIAITIEQFFNDLHLERVEE